MNTAATLRLRERLAQATAELADLNAQATRIETRRVGVQSIIDFCNEILALEIEQAQAASKDDGRENRVPSRGGRPRDDESLNAKRDMIVAFLRRRPACRATPLAIHEAVQKEDSTMTYSGLRAVLYRFKDEAFVQLGRTEGWGLTDAFKAPPPPSPPFPVTP